jgi:hypothetical protein
MRSVALGVEPLEQRLVLDGITVVNGPFILNGDKDAPGESDTFELRLDPNLSSQLQVFINRGYVTGANATPTMTVALTNCTEIDVNGLGGSNTLILDSTYGAINVPNGIVYNGGTDSTKTNVLNLIGGSFTHETTTPTGASSGSLALDNGGSPLENIGFSNVQAVNDGATVTSDTISATAAGSAINVVDGPKLLNGAQATQVKGASGAAFVPVNFANKTMAIVQGATGSFTFTENVTTPAAGLTNLTLNGGDSGNTFAIQAAAVATTINGGNGDDTVNLHDLNNSVTGITAALTINGQGGTNTLNVASNLDTTLSNTAVTSGPMTATLDGNFHTANLTGGSGPNRFDVSGWTGTGTIDGQDGTDTVIATNSGVSFTLTNTSLARTGGYGTLTLASIQAANLTDTGGGQSFDVSAWTGAGTLTGDAAKTDTVIASKSAGSFTLADTSLATTDHMNLTLASMGLANLTGTSSTVTFELDGWTGKGNLTAAGGPGTVTKDQDTNFTLANGELKTSDGMDVTFTGVTIANLTGAGSTDTFNVSGWTGSGTLTGQAGNALVATQANANFTLSNTSLARTGGYAPLNLKGITVANLTDTGGAHTFDVSGWTGTGSLTGDSGKTDTVIATKNTSSFILADGSLATADHMSMTLANLTTANLTGGATSATFDVSSWTGTGALTGQSKTNTVVAADNGVSFTLTNTSLARTGGHGTLTLSGMTAASLTETTGGQTFDVSNWTGTGTLTGDAGKTDSVVAVKNASLFTLADGGLSATDHMNLVLNSIGIADLTGGGGTVKFDVSDWTGKGTLTGGGGSAAIAASKDTNFVLTNAELKTGDAMDVALAGIGAALLTGGPGNNTFDVSGWTGTGALTGGGGSDTLVATDANTSFGLTNSLLTRPGGFGNLGLSGIQIANLTDTGGGQVFDLSGWTGTGTITGDAAKTDHVIAVKSTTSFILSNTELKAADGLDVMLVNLTTAELGGGSNKVTFSVDAWTGNGALEGGAKGGTVTATKDADFTLQNTLLASSDGMSLTLSGIDTANLTGGAGNNHFLVSNWSGAATLLGQGGTNSYTINFVGSGSGVYTITDAGTGSVATINGPAADSTFVINSGVVQRAHEAVATSGIAQLVVNGNSGRDTFNVGVTSAFALNLAVDGAAGTNALNVTDVTVGGGAVIHAPLGTSTSGTVRVYYLGAPPSTITFQNIQGGSLNPDPAHSYVQSLFHQFLDRNATSGEITAWLKIIARPGGVALATTVLAHSVEAYTVLVKGWFQQYLKRAPSSGEVQTWVSLLTAGMTEPQVLGIMLGSPEYYQSVGNTPASFITNLYQVILGRTPMPAELAAWVNSGLPALGPLGVAQAFLNTVEYREDVVAGYYQNMFRRTASPQELLNWAHSPFDLITIAALFAQTPEFFNNAG